MNDQKIVFLTGTRADYGKLKPLMLACEHNRELQLYVFICGMHLFPEYGSTYRDVVADKYRNIYIPNDLALSPHMDIMLANTVTVFSNYIRKVRPDLIVVHGDRIEPLAGAIVGVLNNIMVAHIEGGEVTGTADEFMRHAISKLCGLHFVSNAEAKFRLIQLGERESDIHIFGSPDIDIMLSDSLPALSEVKQRHGIPYEKYAILSYHPVTTSRTQEDEVQQVVEAVKLSGLNYIVIYPNNDSGSKIIRDSLDNLRNDARFTCFRSLPFEDYLVLLKNADFILGNSSAGVREACVYGVPAIDVGTRQRGRYSVSILRNIQHAVENISDILGCISHVGDHRFTSFYYGNGHSTEIFLKAIKQSVVMSAEIQKSFVDTPETHTAIMNYINEVSF